MSAAVAPVVQLQAVNDAADVDFDRALPQERFAGGALFPLFALFPERERVAKRRERKFPRCFGTCCVAVAHAATRSTGSAASTSGQIASRAGKA